MRCKSPASPKTVNIVAFDSVQELQNLALEKISKYATSMSTDL